MADELARSLFDKARDRYENSRRMAFVFVIALLLFHLTTYLPFVRATTRLEQVQAQNQRFQRLRPKLESFQNALAELESRLQGGIRSALAQVRDRKIEDLRELNSMVVEIRSGVDAEGATEGRDSFPPNLQVPEPRQGGRRPQVQESRRRPGFSDVVQSFPGGGSPLPPLGDDLEDKIRQSQTIEEVRGLVKPYVRKEIIDVRFAELNQDLQQMARPLSSDTEDLRDSARQLARESASFTAAFNEIADSLEAFIEAVGDLSVEPPEDDVWWTSVEGKFETFDQLGVTAEDRLSDVLRRELSQKIGDQLKAAINRQEELQASLQEEIQVIEEQFASQQEDMQSMGTFMKWGALSLKPVAASFPLLLALVLAALSFMTSRRTHELALAISILPDERRELWKWLLSRLAGIQGSTPSPGWTAQEGLVAAGAALWVALAAWQVASWSEVGVWQALAMFAVALPVLALAAWYRQRIVRAVLELATGELS